MVEVATAVRLAGFALGTLGSGLLFMEFFQFPSYLQYEPEFDDYSVDISPQEVTEHTWIGRTGALLLAVAFALEFFATLLG